LLVALYRFHERLRIEDGSKFIISPRMLKLNCPAGMQSCFPKFFRCNIWFDLCGESQTISSHQTVTTGRQAIG
jgi:hypothetical protein